MFLVQSFAHLLAVLFDLLKLLLFVSLDVANFALQLVDFLLLLLGVVSAFLPQPIQLLLAVSLRLLERLDLRSELLQDLGMHILLLGGCRQLLLHDDLVVA